MSARLLAIFLIKRSLAISRSNGLGGLRLPLFFWRVSIEKGEKIGNPAER